MNELNIRSLLGRHLDVRFQWLAHSFSHCHRQTWRWWGSGHTRFPVHHETLHPFEHQQHRVSVRQPPICGRFHGAVSGDAESGGDFFQRTKWTFEVSCISGKNDANAFVPVDYEGSTALSHCTGGLGLQCAVGRNAVKTQIFNHLNDVRSRSPLIWLRERVTHNPWALVASLIDIICSHLADKLETKFKTGTVSIPIIGELAL